MRLIFTFILCCLLCSAHAQISADSNTILPSSAPPTANAVFLRPNLYEPGRAHIVVYNWLKWNELTLSLADSGLSVGDRFEVFDVQNLFSPPVASGIYSPASPAVTLPLQLSAVTPIVGEKVPRPPVHTDPVFNVFLVKKTTSPVSAPDAPAERLAFTWQLDAASRTLRISVPRPAPYRALLCDMTGRILVEKTFDGAETELTLPSLSAGIFFLTLSNGNAASARKVLVGP
jgi:hypothetical protein